MGDKGEELLCPECGLRFTRSYNLRRHRETHEKNRRVHECSECDKSYRTKFSLARHKIRVHSPPVAAEQESEEEGGEPLIAPFLEEGEICVECSKLCPDDAALKQHMELAHGPSSKKRKVQRGFGVRLRSGRDTNERDSEEAPPRPLRAQAPPAVPLTTIAEAPPPARSASR